MHTLLERQRQTEREEQPRQEKAPSGPARAFHSFVYRTWFRHHAYIAGAPTPDRERGATASGEGTLGSRARIPLLRVQNVVPSSCIHCWSANARQRERSNRVRRRHPRVPRAHSTPSCTERGSVIMHTLLERQRQTEREEQPRQ